MALKLFVSVAFILLLSSCASNLHTSSPASSAITWESYSDDVFARAKREHKFVIMDLQAVWCHWCHVMDENTYADPAVIKLIQEKYIAVKVDQDSRPDLANKYEDYGWPATVVYNANKQEIVKRQGYIPPMPMARLLQAIIDDPSPGPSVRPEIPIVYSNAQTLSPELHSQLQRTLLDGYDSSKGGWGHIHKYVNADNIEYCLSQADDPHYGMMATQTLTQGAALIDPVWGGVYQYSTDDDWQHPHFEKIISFQADDMRIYAQAYGIGHAPAFLQAAENIHRFVLAFLTSPEGAFYTSQDADLHPGEHSAGYFALDDMARRNLGVPRIDAHIYARENGWMIQSLIAMYAATGEQNYLDDARRAADWIVAHRSLPAGGFRHGDVDAAGPYLGDTLYMGRAFLALYTATGNRSDLTRAIQAASFIATHFQSPTKPGFQTAVGNDYLEGDENIAAARFGTELFSYTGNAIHRELAQRAMNFICDSHTVADRGMDVGGILLADAQAAAIPLHITVVGSKDDPAARALFLAALQYPAWPKRLEWYDPHEGPLPNADVQYPVMKRPAAFLCTAGACSAPAFSAEALNATLARRHPSSPSFP